MKVSIDSFWNFYGGIAESQFNLWVALALKAVKEDRQIIQSERKNTDEAVIFTDE